MNKVPNLLDVLAMLYQRRRFILGLTIVAAFLSIIISLFFMDTYYKAQTVFYAASPDLARPERLMAEGNVTTYFYGSDEDVDRLLALATSDHMYAYLIDKHNLYSHYGIDSTSVKAPIMVRNHLRSLYQVANNSYGGITLSVEDKQPKKAAFIANDARSHLNNLAIEVIRANQRLQVSGFNEVIDQQERILIRLQDSLLKLRSEYGIYNAQTQSEGLSEELELINNKLTRTQAKLDYLSHKPDTRRWRDSIETISFEEQSLIAGKEQLLRRLDVFNSGLDKVQSMTDEMRTSSQQINKIKDRSKRLQTSQNSQVSALHIIEPASVPLIKSRPHRAVIVIGSTFLAFVAACMLTLIWETYQGVNGALSQRISKQ